MKLRAGLAILALAVVGCSPHNYTLKKGPPQTGPNLPLDNAAHADAQTEWWYYAGHLFAEDGQTYGFEFTIFKRLTDEDVVFWAAPANWFRNPALAAHFAISDEQKKRHYLWEENNFPTNDGSVDFNRFNSRVAGWRMRRLGDSFIIEAGDAAGYRLELSLRPSKPPALHGRGGVVMKSKDAGNVYYSYSRLEAQGYLTVAGQTKPVKGQAWMDHEYGDMPITGEKKGWDWFSLQLDNNQEVMIYLVKDKDEVVAEAGGSWILADGAVEPLKLEDVTVEQLGTWKSEKSGAVYPMGWVITLPGRDAKFTVKPTFEDQELIGFPVTYWEGRVTVEGAIKGAPIKGLGYVELVGYDKKRDFDDWLF